jgi:hypothetical protein
MSRGRSPEKGETALSNAERQARYRDRHKQAPVVVVQPRKPADRRPRPQRWHDAVTELLALQAAYAAWFEALPESLRGTATADALEAIAELDLDALAAITPPRGYGRD